MYKDTALSITAKNNVQIKTHKPLLFESYDFFQNITELANEDVPDYDLSMFDAETIEILLNILNCEDLEFSIYDNSQLLNIIKLHDYLMPHDEEMDGLITMISNKIIDNVTDPFEILHLFDGNESKYMQNIIDKVINKYGFEIYQYINENIGSLLRSERTKLYLLTPKIIQCIYSKYEYLRNNVSSEVKSDFMKFCIGNGFYVYIDIENNNNYTITVSLNKKGDSPTTKITDIVRKCTNDDFLSSTTNVLSQTLIGNDKSIFKKFKNDNKLHAHVDEVKYDNTNYNIIIKMWKGTGFYDENISTAVYYDEEMENAIMDILLKTLNNN